MKKFQSVVCRLLFVLAAGAQFTQVCFRRRVTQTGKGRGDGLAKKMTKDFSIKSFFARPSRYNEHYGAEQKKGFSFLDAKHCGCHHSAHYIKLRAAAADCNQLKSYLGFAPC